MKRKRLELSIPESLYNEIKQAADALHLSLTAYLTYLHNQEQKRNKK
jgi:hypothetical protein